ncbi:hypothetical protein D3C72_1681710 [compost metagenome]
MAQFAYLTVIVDAGLADHRHPVWDARRQLASAIQIDTQVAQIAVIDTDHARFQSNGPLQLFFADHFGQHAHVQAVRNRSQLTVLIVVQHGQHQQNGVGLIEARQIDLIRVDNKVFAQHRLCHRLADQRQEVEAALEVFFIGQHRDRRGEILVDLSDFHRIKVFADQPFGR